jgi:protein-L-isoaspartate O-methyltransferase
MSEKAETLIRRVLEAHRVMHAETDLSPRNPAVNGALSALVYGVLGTYTPAEEREILSDPRVQAARAPLLRRLAQAEGEMEKFWAEFFCARDTLTPEDLKEFQYWDCYDNLVNGEIAAMPRGVKPEAGQSIAFVGAGPLPLTAIILHLRTGMPVTCVDNDPRACEFAAMLCRKMGLGKIDVVCADGADYSYERHPMVFIASLVPEKKRVIERIREAGRTAFVALRSADRLHTLLYEPVSDAEMKAAGCSFRGRTAHDPRVINTTLFYAAPHKPIPRIVPKAISL